MANIMKTNLKHVTSALGCVLLVTGCAWQQQGKKTPPPAQMSAPGPSANMAYFPSGTKEGSGLSVEKTAPAQVLVGRPYEYTYVVSNISDATLENVVVMDRVTSDFTFSDSEPAASRMAGGRATWNLGALAPKESKTITVRGSSADEGVVTTCGWASYNPVLCQDIHIVKANIALTKTEPPDVLICDPIPTTLTVQNTGSSPLTGVEVTDTLPTGMNAGGKSSVTFDAAYLAVGDSTNFQYNATATSTGALVNNAKVTSSEGVSAEATATTTVHQPVLAITCKAADQEYIGRRFDVSYTVSSTGDAPAAGSKLEIAVPAGLDVSSAGTGQVSNGKIDYDLGTVENSIPQTVTATFTSATSGTFDFTGSVSGSCAAAATTTCETKVVGVPAILLEKSDNPDPVAVGATTVYTVKVTNQGSADDSNVAISIVVDAELVPVSSDQPTATINGQTVTFAVIPTLAAQQSVTYTIVAKGVTPGDAHTRFILSSANVTTPSRAEESTTVY
jgi:uncharacterized repeat protein (TIGR01451 family)